MKLKYKHQRFQANAAKSVTDLFIGQQYCDGADFLIDQGIQNHIIYGFMHKSELQDILKVNKTADNWCVLILS